MTSTRRRMRAEAMLICALSASNHVGQDVSAAWIEASKDAIRLAEDAYNAASFLTRWATWHHSWCELNAEAEAMLRRGWPARDGFPLFEG